MVRAVTDELGIQRTSQFKAPETSAATNDVSSEEEGSVDAAHLRAQTGYQPRRAGPILVDEFGAVMVFQVPEEIFPLVENKKRLDADLVWQGATYPKGTAIISFSQLVMEGGGERQPQRCTAAAAAADDSESSDTILGSSEEAEPDVSDEPDVSPVGRAVGVVKLGIYHTPSEFAEEALKVTQPTLSQARHTCVLGRPGP